MDDQDSILIKVADTIRGAAPEDPAVIVPDVDAPAAKSPASSGTG
jgi:hypothetical protein